MTVLKLRNRGSVSRISYDGETALNSRHLCAEYAVGLGPDELSRLQRSFRDQYPHASVRVGPTSGFPGGYYILQTYEPIFATFMTDRDRQTKAKIDAGVGKGYGAAKRKHSWQFGVVIQGHEFAVDSGDPDSIRALLETMAIEVEEARKKIDKIKAIKPVIRKSLRLNNEAALEIGRLRTENSALRAECERNKKPRYRVQARGRRAA